MIDCRGVVRPIAFALAFAALAACGEGAREPTAAAAERLRAHATPEQWEPLSGLSGTPARRRDPRTGITFRLVPAGEFRAGGVRAGDGPARTVRITKSFWLAETELTVAQWRTHVDAFAGDPNVPVPAAAPATPMPLSWLDAEAYCARYGYRLPTEAEWELACLAGRAPDDPRWTDEAAVREEAWVHANAGDAPRDVRTRAANAFGLHDTIGNVWEWCSDRYASGVRAGPDPDVDPTGAADGSPRVLRGGSWFTLPLPRPQTRTGSEPHERNAFYGVRPACSAVTG